MSTLAEIEAAIETLPASQAEELANWLNRRLSSLPADRSASELRKAGEPKSVRDFFGCFASGNPGAGDNESIDADLSRNLSQELDSR